MQTSQSSPGAGLLVLPAEPARTLLLGEAAPRCDGAAHRAGPSPRIRGSEGHHHGSCHRVASTSSPTTCWRLMGLYHVRSARVQGEGLGVLDEHRVRTFEPPSSRSAAMTRRDLIVGRIRGFFRSPISDQACLRSGTSAKDYTAERCKELIPDESASRICRWRSWTSRTAGVNWWPSTG